MQERGPDKIPFRQDGAGQRSGEPPPTIEQIVARCGDGRLVDGSVCAKEFRLFLGVQSAATLARYANYCVVVRFAIRTAVLADITNEMGRRLGYEVAPAPYVVAGAPPPASGCWRRGSFELHVQATASNPPRVDIDKLFAAGMTADGDRPVMRATARFAVITGRHDTTAIRARLGGHPHRSLLRLLTIDGLTRMVAIAEEVRGTDRTQNIRGILTPGDQTVRSLRGLPDAGRG